MKRIKRGKLALRGETVRRLSGAQIIAVVGGRPPIIPDPPDPTDTCTVASCNSCFTCVTAPTICTVISNPCRSPQ